MSSSSVTWVTKEGGEAKGARNSLWRWAIPHDLGLTWMQVPHLLESLAEGILSHQEFQLNLSAPLGILYPLLVWPK